MKTRSGSPPGNPYQLSEALWRLPNACAIWMLYDAATLDPISYYLLGFPMPYTERFGQSNRSGYRNVKMQQANHAPLGLPELAAILFPQGSQQGTPGDALDDT